MLLSFLSMWSMCYCPSIASVSYVIVIPQHVFFVLLSLFCQCGLHYFPPSEYVPCVIVLLCSIIYWPSAACVTCITVFPQHVFDVNYCPSSVYVLLTFLSLCSMYNCLSRESFPCGILSFMGMCHMCHCLSSACDACDNRTMCGKVEGV